MKPILDRYIRSGWSHYTYIEKFYKQITHFQYFLALGCHPLPRIAHCLLQIILWEKTRLLYIYIYKLMLIWAILLSKNSALVFDPKAYFPHTSIIQMKFSVIMKLWWDVGVTLNCPGTENTICAWLKLLATGERNTKSALHACTTNLQESQGFLLHNSNVVLLYESSYIHAVTMLC